MTIAKTALCFVFFLSQLALAQNLIPNIYANWSFNGQKMASVESGKVQEWRFKFFEKKNNLLINKFLINHGRPIHLVVIKEDLSSFAHVHPTLIGDTGEFMMIANQASYDPDNQQAAMMTPTPGKYFVFAEVAPDRGALVATPETVRMELQAKGAIKDQSMQKDDLLESVVDMQEHGKIVQYYRVKKDRQGRMQMHPGGQFGDKIRVELMVHNHNGCGGNMVDFMLKMQLWDEDQLYYITNRMFENWLGMPGHGILVSALNKDLKELSFHHLHAMQNRETGMVHYRFFDRRELAKRPFKLWAQVKYKGQILTFPFLFHLHSEYGQTCRAGQGQGSRPGLPGLPNIPIKKPGHGHHGSHQLQKIPGLNSL
jgi:hypothetical protein